MNFHFKSDSGGAFTFNSELEAETAAKVQNSRASSMFDVFYEQPQAHST